MINAPSSLSFSLRPSLLAHTAVLLAGLGFGLTISVRSMDSLEFKDWVLPLAVGGYVYWRNGVLGQADGGAGNADDEPRSDGVLDRRCEERGGAS